MLDSLQKIARLEAQIQRWAPKKKPKTKPPSSTSDDPVTFAREVLKLRLWPRQEEILRAAFEHDKTAVRSGHKIGKSTAAIVIALWFCSNPIARPGARVVMTSASGRQVKSILWRELRRLYRPVKAQIGGVLNKDPNTGLVWDDGREILGYSTDESEKMAGVSGAHVLFIVDEASGVDEGIFDAIEGNRAGGARLVMFSNPTRTSGTFFDAFHSKRQFWHGIKVSSEEAAKVTPAIPGLATQAWIDEKKKDWGPGSPIYKVRAEGEFPTQGERAVVALAAIDAARLRYDERMLPPQGVPVVLAEGPLEFGLDVARFGIDETVLMGRRSRHAFPAVVIPGNDGPTTAGLVLEEVAKRRVDDEPVKIKVDVIGVGASVYDSLKLTAPPGVEIIAVNVAEKSTDEATYRLLRDQLWFAARDWLKEGGEIPDDPKLEAELLAPEYSFDARGRYVVESKDETKRRLKRSPDRADALGLAVYNAPVEFYDTDDAITIPQSR